MNWRQGQRIIVTSTDYHPTKLSSTFTYPVQTEEVGVRSVVGNVVTLETPLRYMHWGVAPEAAEVGYVFYLFFVVRALLHTNTVTCVHTCVNMCIHAIQY